MYSFLNTTKLNINTMCKFLLLDQWKVNPLDKSSMNSSSSTSDNKKDDCYAYHCILHCEVYRFINTCVCHIEWEHNSAQIRARCHWTNRNSIYWTNLNLILLYTTTRMIIIVSLYNPSRGVKVGKSCSLL